MTRVRIALCTALITHWLIGASALAQGFPVKTVRMIVPFPPGQATDIVARMLAERLTATWNQTVIVENRAGGGGVPGILAGRDAPADGYTLFVGTSLTHVYNPWLFRKMPYRDVEDFAPVTLISGGPLMLAVNAQLLARSLS